MPSNIYVEITIIEQFCRQNHIRKLSLFGSVLRDDFTADSDVDVLVEFEQGAVITYLDMVDIQDRLSDLLGFSVDLLTPNALSPYFRDDVLTTAQVIYEQPR